MRDALRDHCDAVLAVAAALLALSLLLTGQTWERAYRAGAERGYARAYAQAAQEQYDRGYASAVYDYQSGGASWAR